MIPTASTTARTTVSAAIFVVYGDDAIASASRDADGMAQPLDAHVLAI